MAFDFLFTLLVSCPRHCVSYNNMARNLCNLGDTSVSKQALQKAMTCKRFLLFIKIILKNILAKKLKENIDTSLWQHALFKRIVVQDSTVLKLPSGLFSIFSGVSNGVSQVANARVQFAFDLLNERVIYLSVDSYGCNDIKKARCLDVKGGDLILRDRGYFSRAEIVRMNKLKADFIYRYKHITCLDAVTGRPIVLLTMLRLNPNLDIMVRLIDEQGPVVRLVASAVNEELANRRRQKLKKEAKHKPGEACLALLSWSIFFTSVKQEQMNYKAVYQLYTLRWRVEILFKAMKSNLNFGKIHNICSNQFYFIVYAKLIFIILITQFIYLPARTIIKQHFNKEISIIKLTAFIGENPMNMIEIIDELLFYDNEPKEKLKALVRYCCYDKRTRRNYHQFAHDTILS